MSSMMKGIVGIIPLFVLVALLTPSCSSTEKQDEYHDWQERNDAFIEDVADEVKLYADRGIRYDNASVGDRFRLPSYKLDSLRDDWNTSDYIYCTVIAKGNGTESPLYTDSVRIHYRCRLMPTDEHPNGFVAEQTYKTALPDIEVNVPKDFVVSGLVCGVATALQKMKAGDHWQLHIPYELGYNASVKTNIPAYSTLVFDIRLLASSHVGTPLPKM